MRILIVTSCTGEKAHTPAQQLTQDDFVHLHEGPAFTAREARLAEYRTKAEDMYTGQQHVRLMRGVRTARQKLGAEAIDLHILSAGYGLIAGAREIVPYECTFQGMKVRQLRAWADYLDIPEAIRDLLAQPYDLALVLLGTSYLRACRLRDDVLLGGQTVAFCSPKASCMLPKLQRLHVVTLSNADAQFFGCGMIALKGELGARILKSIPKANNSRELYPFFEAATFLWRDLTVKGNTTTDY